jgi:hypothetical protein
MTRILAPLPSPFGKPTLCLDPIVAIATVLAAA